MRKTSRCSCTLVWAEHDGTGRLPLKDGKATNADRISTEAHQHDNRNTDEFLANAPDCPALYHVRPIGFETPAWPEIALARAQGCQSLFSTRPHDHRVRGIVSLVFALRPSQESPMRIVAANRYAG